MRNGFVLAAHAVQILAVCRHGLDQILSKSVLHNKNTSKIKGEKFKILTAGSDAPLNQAWGYYSTGSAAEKTAN